MKKPRPPSSAPPHETPKASRHAPREMTLSGPVGYVGRSVGVQGRFQHRTGFDPRFEELCGKVKESKLDQDYAFVAEMRADELAQLKDAAAREKDPDRKLHLVADAKRLADQERGRNWAKKTKQLRNKVQMEEREKVKNGKKPYYMKKSSLRDLETKMKYDELKQQGKLNKYIEKRRKKQASRDKRQLPALREDQTD